MLVEKLCAARPDYGWLSEESEDSDERLSKDRVFIIDPIDGTRSFAQGSKTWAHAIAVAEHGVVTAGVVFLPMRDLLYTASVGQGAFLNGNRMRPDWPNGMPDAQVLAARPTMNASHWKPGQIPAFNRAYRPSLAYRMALVAEGRFDGMLTLRPCWEWDIAAGDLILREAGAACTDRNGAALQFNNPHPKQNGVVAAGSELHDEIREALHPG